RSGRAQWLAWHDVLARQAPADVDPRSLAFAAATGLGAALVPAVAPIGAIGVAGVTTTSLEQLAALV
ncbi:MAG: hypothetical protein JWN72_187, partial [Thermoleophilia bacterium]|nr:hypothetical protein [Thermoleophilia bacterium]